MVPVGGVVGVAITTEQERIKAAFHEGPRALHTGAEPRGTRPPVDIYRSENMGQAGRRGSPTSLKIGPGGTAGGNVDRVVVVLFECPALGCLARTQRAFFGGRMYEVTFLGPERSNCLARARGCRPSSRAQEPRRCPLTNSGRHCKEHRGISRPTQPVTRLTKYSLSCCL